MKIKSVKANNRKRAFEVASARGTYSMPYAKLDVVPTSENPILELYIDPELACEGFTYVLKSGEEDSVLLDEVFYYNEEPIFMRKMLLFDLTVQAKQCLAASPLRKREIMRRARTSPAQFYRLLDTTNHTKSVDKMLVLLSAMDCTVTFDVQPRARRSA